MRRARTVVTSMRTGSALTATVCSAVGTVLLMQKSLMMFTSYVNKHMAAHANTAGHYVAVSLSDLSVWCFRCDAYVLNKVLHLFQ